MGECVGGNKKSENKGNRKHQTSDLLFDDRTYKKKENNYGRTL